MVLRIVIDEEIHICGCCRVGDNIEDEWFIVYLLFQLSKNIQSLNICIEDSDDQFLLIEAADEIPAWINPENCKFCTWIKNERIHILNKDDVCLNGNDLSVF